MSVTTRDTQALTTDRWSAGRRSTLARSFAALGGIELLVVAIAFAAMCVAVLTRSVQLLEPDDYAYRAAIIALTQGHLTLTSAQYQALLLQLSAGGGPGIMQWVQTTSGMWISEKNPGYPFLAAPFQALGLLRLAPLFYGALGCIGLFAGARRWLGRWGGAYAVILFCSSGAALVFAWRATMPTFTDASLIAAGSGALLWALLARDRATRWRTLAGLGGFVALEAAVFVRYTDVVVLAVAAVAALALSRPARLRWQAPALWMGSVALFTAGVLGFDQLFYGGALKTGYASGEITFSLGSFIPNLKEMPVHLVSAMPMLVLGFAAVGWLAVRALRSRRHEVAPSRRAASRQDAAVGAVLACGWLAIWGLYLTYDWTVQAATGPGTAVHVVRFYLPAIGLIALLGAWLLVQLPRWAPVLILGVLIGLGAWSFPTLAAAGVGGPGGGPLGGPGGGLGGPFGGPNPGGGPGSGTPPRVP